MKQERRQDKLTMKEFKINDYLTLKLEKDITNIYVNGDLFNQCKYLIFHIPIDHVQEFDNIQSIDEMAEIDLSNQFLKLEINPEDEFWGHSSNLQIWYEYEYKTTILHSNLAFPLLKKLTEVGDPLAKRVFKEEIVKRIRLGYIPTILFLLENNYIDYLDENEYELIFIEHNPKLKEYIENIDITEENNLLLILSTLSELGDPLAKQLFEEKILRLFSNEASYQEKYLLYKKNLKSYHIEEIEYLKQFNALVEIENISSYYQFSINDKVYPLSNLNAKTEGFNVIKLTIHEIVKGRMLKNLPNSFGNLKYLQELSISKTLLVNLPKSIGNLTSIKKINLRDNWLEELPNSIDNLVRLRFLNLYNNKLASIPESIGSLNSLQILNLNQNRLSSIPESIGSLNSLQSLNLTNNNLISIPESIGALNSLQTLDLTNNKLSSIPESIGALNSLQTLDLTNNKLTSIPESIQNLRIIIKLNLKINYLRTFPKSITKLTSLQKLIINNNQLKTLPDSIGNLTSLIYLNLENNQLKTFPGSIGDLTSLKYLNLKGNEVLEFDLSILKNCKNLDDLRIDSNIVLYWKEEKKPKRITLPKGIQKYYYRLKI